MSMQIFFSNVLPAHSMCMAITIYRGVTDVSDIEISKNSDSHIARFSLAFVRNSDNIGQI